MHSIYLLFMHLLDAYSWVVVFRVIFSLLLSLGIINAYHPLVQIIGNFLVQITEPVLRPIRNFLPDLAGLDFSPAVLLLLIWIVQALLTEYISPYFYTRSFLF